MNNRFSMYLEALTHPFQKRTRLEFLNPDDSVAFALDNQEKRILRGKYDSRAFVQSGSLNVSLQNGVRRKASVTLSNLDNAFDYAVNKIWFGQRVRLSMGLVLPDGTDFYLPQGVFYLDDPQTIFQPSSRQATYQLTDKWSYLDGSLFGRLPFSLLFEREINVFNGIQGLLRLSKVDFAKNTTDPSLWVDATTPVFTSFYNSLPNVDYTYTDLYGNEQTVSVPRTSTAFETTVQMGGTIADGVLGLNENLVAWVGYDQTGALRIEPSQDDVSDANKPIQWFFTPQNSQLLGVQDSYRNKEVYNDIIICGQGLDDVAVYGRATNYDPMSDTNVNLIGMKTYKEDRANYWNENQCVSLAKWKLKRQTVLQKTVSVQSSQMFHLIENRLISIKRTDKQGSPIERHLIQSFSLPLGETGSMTINAVSVNDYEVFATTSSVTE